MQSLPLDLKIKMTKRRIQEWYDAFDSNVYVSFSGGKDSTVLKHIVDSMYKDIPAMFVNTGLEYPEIQRFVKEVKAGKYDCFNTDVVIVRPEMRFDEVIKKYGYPVISKEISQKIYDCRRATANGNPDNCIARQFNGTYVSKNGKTNLYSIKKYKPLYESNLPISGMCCDVMKKRTAKKYEKDTGRKAFIGTMASESVLRRRVWLANGCNAFNAKRPVSNPLSFWIDQDILQYIIKYNVPYSQIYGDIIKDANDKYKCSGTDRTGCMFCMYGVHLEKEPNRFQKMKITHPRQYEYCMNDLGLKEVLEFIGIPYE